MLTASNEWLIEWAVGATQFGAHWLVQSTLVIALGLAAGWLLRRRGPALQSAIYRTTLVMALACPAVGLALSAAGLTFATFELPALRIAVVEDVPAEQVVLEPANSPDPTVIFSRQEPQPDREATAAGRDPVELRHIDRVESADTTADPNPLRIPATTAAAPVPLEEPSQAKSSAPTKPRWVIRPAVAAVVLAASGFWFVGASLLVARLAIACRRLRRIVRSAHPASQEEAALCARLAARLHVAPPRLLRTPHVSSPCLAGIRRPAVLLGDELAGAPLSSVLTHELAHLARNDCAWNLLRQLATAIGFFQPLVWVLSRRLETAAEEVCDDYVVELGGDRQAYAEALVTLAERIVLPASTAAVSLVTLRSLLSRRVLRVLDRSRRLSIRVGLAALCLIAVVGLAATLLAGLFGPGPQAVAATTTPDDKQTGDRDKPDAQEPSANADAKDKQADAFVIRGQLISPDGKPAEGAAVALIGRRRASFHAGKLESADTIVVLGEGGSDAAGRFSLSPAKVRASEFHWVQLLARSAQSGLAWRAVNPDIREAEFKIELPKTQVTRGRLISLESAPAAGVKVLVDKIGHKGPGEFLGVDSMLAKLPSTVWPNDVVTDADGWFAVPGVAEGCDLNLRVSQEPYAPAWWLWDAGDAATHVHPLSPAQVITGVVVAADTQQPVPFARLTAFQAWDPNRGGMMGVDGQADAQGRFRLNPFPANGFVVTGFATPGTPYLARKVEFDWPKAAREHELRVELPRGVLLQGTITAVPDGRPIAGASVQYEPGQKNRFAKEHLVNGWQATAASDATGHYAIAVPPGAGSIRVMCPGGDCVVEQLSESQLFEGKPGGRHVYVHAHAMLDLPEDAREQTLNLQVQRGVRFEARIEGIDGRAPETTLVAYQGMAAPWDHHFGHIPRTIHGGQLEIASVPPQGELTVILLDPVGKQGCVYTVRGKDAAKPQVIRLEKCASAEMRCIDTDGKPVPGTSQWLTMVFTPGPSPYGAGMRADVPFADTDSIANFDRLNHWDLISGEDGVLKMPALVPGVEYRLMGGDDKGRPIDKDSLVLAPGEHKKLPDLVIKDAAVLQKCEERWAERQKKLAAEASKASADQDKSNSLPPDGAKADPASKPAEPADRYEFAGRVLDVNGKPAPGAKLSLFLHARGEAAVKPLGETAADGNFRFALTLDEINNPDSDHPWDALVVAATAPQRGTALALAASFETSGQLEARLRGLETWRAVGLVPDRTLQLVADDVPIAGRILDLEGKPLAGAKIHLLSIHFNRKNSLDPWLNAIENENADWFRAHHYVDDAPTVAGAEHFTHLFGQIVTGADGRFQIRGIGRERLALLQVEGPGIESRRLYVRTRPGPLLHIVYQGRNPNGASDDCYGAAFDFVAAPGRAAEGVVRDKDTGQPLAGIELSVQKLAGKELGTTKPEFHATTDPQGHYRLSGLPIGTNELVALPPDDQPFMNAARKVETTAAAESARLDFELKRGIWIRGRVTDSASGRPLRARVEYFALLTNPHLKSAKGVMGAHQQTVRTDRDGHYQIAALPGRGIVGVMAGDWMLYPRGAGGDKITEGRQGDGRAAMFQTQPYYLVAVNQHALAEVNPAEQVESINQDFALDPGNVIAGSVVDAAGKPLPGATFSGENDILVWRPLTSSSFVVRHLGPGGKRRISAVHNERCLSGSLVVSGDDKNPQVVMRPWGTVKGRVLQSDGEIAAQVALHHGAKLPRLVNDNFGLLPRDGTPTTDKEGRFTIDGLVDGLQYAIFATQDGRHLGTVIERFQVASGETKDLGDLTLQADATMSRAEQKPKQSDPTAAVRQTTSSGVGERPLVFAGKVLDIDGKPAAGAKVYLLDYNRDVQADRPSATSAADGGFTFTVSQRDLENGRSDEAWQWTSVVAKAEGRGLALTLAAAVETTGQLEARLRTRPRFRESREARMLEQYRADRSLRLVADDAPLAGRVLNLEGTPVGGVTVRVIEIHSNRANSLDGWLNAVENEHAAFNTASTQFDTGFIGPAIQEQFTRLFPQVVTTADGRFQIAGIGRERLVRLRVEVPGIQTQQIWARTRKGPTLHIDDRRPKYETIDCYGASFDFVAAPSRPLLGMVRDKDTGKPMAGVTVQGQHLAGMHIHGWPNTFVRTTTDAEGRYRLTGLPLGENELMAVPTDAEPYLVSSREVEITPNQETATLDFELKKGIWCTGRITDAQSGQGVRAQVEYFAFFDNPNRNAARGLMQAIEPFNYSDRDGRFKLAVLPGRGIVGVSAANWMIYPRGVGAEAITEGRERTEDDYVMFRTYPHPCISTNQHALTEISPEAGDANVERNFVLDTGTVREGTVLDADGKPLAGAMFAGELQTLFFRSLDSATFRIRHLKPGQKRRIAFYHVERRLAGSALVSGDDAGPVSVTLEPWGMVTGRILQRNGDELPGAQLLNGTNRKARAAGELGTLPGEREPMTDDDGRFIIEGFAPGIDYSIAVIKQSRGFLGNAIDRFRLAPGETKDLGDLTLHPAK